jgi:hypothetical protein
MRTLSGRDDTPGLELVSGEPAALRAVEAARVPF